MDLARAKIILAGLLVINLFLPVEPDAQLAPFNLGYFFSEDELKAAFFSGELTYDEYLDLLQRLQDLASSPVPDSEIVELSVGDQARIDTTLNRDSEARPEYSTNQKLRLFFPLSTLNPKPALSATFRSVFTQEIAFNGKQESYTVARFIANKNCSGGLAFEKRPNQELVFRRRHLQLQSDRLGVILGSYDLKIGTGLLFGHNWRVLSKSSLPAEPGFTLGYPVYNRYNGALISVRGKRLKLAGFFSFDRNLIQTEQLYGATLSFGSSAWVLGTALGANRLAANQQQDWLTASSIFGTYRSKPILLSLELAQVIKRSPAFMVELTLRDERSVLFGSFWKYGNSFTWAHSGGRANPDFVTVSLLEGNFSYRSPQQNETGFFFKSLLAFSSRISGELKFTTWKQKTTNQLNKGYVGLNWAPYHFQFVSFFVQSKSAGIDADSVRRVSYGIDWLYTPTRRFNFYLGSELKSHGSQLNFASYQLRTSYSIIRALALLAWIKYAFAWQDSRVHFWQGYLAERVTISPRLTLGAKYLFDYNRSYVRQRVDFWRVELEGGF